MTFLFDFTVLKTFIRSQLKACKDEPAYALYYLQGIQSTLIVMNQTESEIWEYVQSKISLVIKQIEGK